jgi:hypothetical protein
MSIGVIVMIVLLLYANGMLKFKTQKISYSYTMHILHQK